MFLGMKMQGYKSYLYKGTIVTYMNPRMGAGVSFGLFIFVSQGCDGLVPHEWGHSIQTCIWGPLFMLVIGIPSFIRFIYRERMYKRSEDIVLPPYDSIWFEGQATRWGDKYCENDSLISTATVVRKNKV